MKILSRRPLRCCSTHQTAVFAAVHRFSVSLAENSVFPSRALALENLDVRSSDTSALCNFWVTNLLRVSTTLLLNNDKIYKITQRFVYFAHLQDRAATLGVLFALLHCSRFLGSVTLCVFSFQTSSDKTLIALSFFLLRACCALHIRCYLIN